MSLRPICFMVMPFGTKDRCERAASAEVVDFDVLWRVVIAPALESMGYRAVRVDQDTGAVIVKEMLERLFFAPGGGRRQHRQRQRLLRDRRSPRRPRGQLRADRRGLGETGVRSPADPPHRLSAAASMPTPRVPSARC